MTEKEKNKIRIKIEREWRKKLDTKNINKDDDLMDLGKFYFLNKKFENAKEMFLKALKAIPNDHEAAYNLGLCYEAMNDIENAIIFYKKTLEINKDCKLANDHLQKLVGTD